MIDPMAHTSGFSAMAGLNMPRTAGRMPGLNDSAVNAATTAAAKTAATIDDPAPKVTFIDFLKGLIDVINPLQHIPVVSTFYRDLTGDEISPMARVVGKTLYGGPIGMAFAMGDVAYKHATGKDIGATMLASARSTTEEQSTTALQKPPTQIAARQPTATAKTPEKEKDTPPLLQAQEAVHDSVITDLPPDLLAARMMAALDQYQSMKKGGLSPQLSARY